MLATCSCESSSGAIAALLRRPRLSWPRPHSGPDQVALPDSRADHAPSTTGYSLVTKQAVPRGLLTTRVIPTLVVCFWREQVVVDHLWLWFSGSILMSPEPASKRERPSLLNEPANSNNHNGATDAVSFALSHDRQHYITISIRITIIIIVVMITRCMYCDCSGQRRSERGPRSSTRSNYEQQQYNCYYWYDSINTISYHHHHHQHHHHHHM